MKIIVFDSIFPNKIGLQEHAQAILSLKPDTALLRNNNAFFIPNFSNQIYYGLYLVIRICKMGKCISPVFAGRYYEEIGIGINFTAIDVLEKCIIEKRPHEEAYIFDNSSAISLQFIQKQELSKDFQFQLNVNGKLVQHAHLHEMKKNIDELISEASQRITLKIGDYLFLGTPGESIMAKIDDRLQGFLDQKLLLDFTIQ